MALTLTLSLYAQNGRDPTKSDIAKHPQIGEQLGTLPFYAGKVLVMLTKRASLLCSFHLRDMACNSLRLFVFVYFHF